MKVSRGSLFVALVAGCAGLSVHSNFNPATDFDKYRTYAWVPAEQNLPPGSPAEQRIQADVDRELLTKGLMAVPPGVEPDFLVAYHVGPHGTLALELIDPTTREAFWRGTASDVVENARSGGRIDEAVAKLMERYPPGPKSIAEARPR